MALPLLRALRRSRPDAEITLLARAPFLPLLADLEVAFGLFGFFGDSPSAALVEKRRELFAGVAHHHHYAAARSIADLVSEDLLRLAPDDAASQGLPA